MKMLFLEKQRRRYSHGLKNPVVMLLISLTLLAMLFVVIGPLMLKPIIQSNFIVTA